MFIPSLADVGAVLCGRLCYRRSAEERPQYKHNDHQNPEQNCTPASPPEGLKDPPGRAESNIQSWFYDHFYTTYLSINCCRINEITQSVKVSVDRTNAVKVFQKCVKMETVEDVKIKCVKCVKMQTVISASIAFFGFLLQLAGSLFTDPAEFVNFN